jgi:hypothetical protein
MKCIFGLALLLILTALAPRAIAATTIPFVGCIEVGATANDGSWTAPLGKPMVTDLPPAIASQLAIYVSNWSAVLAPRGWACRSRVEALQGVDMIVSPLPRDGDDRAVLSGPAIILWNNEKPRTVASYTARYFPQAVAAVAANDDVCGAACDTFLEPKGGTPLLAPSYPSDMIRHRGDLVLEYTTPANRPGLGHQIGLSGSGQFALISYGVLALSDLPRGEGGIVNLTVRLPSKLNFLHDAIIKSFEACMPNHNLVGCESGGAFVAQGRPLDDGD